MWDKRAEYLDNEADSVKMVLDQGFGDTKLVDVRLLGIYAPESGAKECKEFIAKWFDDIKLAPGTRWGCIVTTTQVGRFEWVAVVTDITNSSNLNAALANFIYDSDFPAPKKTT